MPGRSSSPTRGALLVAVGYLLIAGIYIAVSSTWVGTVEASPAIQAWIEVGKGFAFVLVTASLLFLAMRRQLARIQQVERALADRAQALTRAELRASVAMVAGSVAHEMKNMITVLQGAQSLLARDSVRTGPEASELLQDMAIAIDRLGNLSRDLVNRSRAREPRPEPLQVDSVLPDIARLLRAIDRDRRVDLQLRLEPGCVIVIDRLDLEYAIVNLVINASEAGAHKVELRAERFEGGVRVSVADDGPGVAPELQDRIFEPFVSTKPGTGRGLGLAIVREALQRNEATIRVQPGPGAVFVMEFSRKA